MKKLLFIFLTFLLVSACKDKPVKPVTIVPPVVSPPASDEIQAVITSLSVPRVLKIDQSIKIVIKGYFDISGYGFSRVEMKRDDNEIAFKVFGKKTNLADSRFTKTITLPPQPVGEYDIVVYGKNKRLNDITWVEAYQGEEEQQYLRRLKELRAQNPGAVPQTYSPNSFQVN